MAASPAKAFGSSASDSSYDDPEDAAAGTPEDDDEAGDSSLPPDFESAYDEYQANPSAQSFWDAVEACTQGKSGGGLALLIGKTKSKGK